MSATEILTLESIWNNLSPTDVAKLCLVSRMVRRICPIYLQGRARRELRDPSVTVNSTDDYVRVMSQGMPDFVMRGSENFIPLDEAIFRSVKVGDRRLINYFLRQSPEADEGCQSKHVTLVLFCSAILDRDDIGIEIMRKCPKMGDDIKDLKENLYEYKVIYDFDSPSLIEHLPLAYPEDVVIIAAEEGNLSVIKYLLSRNSTLNLNRALIRAAGEGHLDVVKYLLSVDPELGLQGGPIQHAFIDTLTERHLAKRHLDVIGYLLLTYPWLDLNHVLNTLEEEGYTGKIRYLRSILPEQDWYPAWEAMQS